MINISMKQLLDVWVELEDAYNGVNGYGGDTTETYAYLVMPFSPTYVNTRYTEGSSFDKDNIQLELQAAKSLYEILCQLHLIFLIL